jgi:hypothetical protein
MGKVEDISVPGGLTVLTQLLARAINISTGKMAICQ